jgi:hypothetical protein
MEPEFPVIPPPDFVRRMNEVLPPGPRRGPFDPDISLLWSVVRMSAVQPTHIVLTSVV